MTTISIKHFSWIDFIQGLKAAKFTDTQAEYLAKKTEDLIENVLEHSKHELENRDLATKGDILSIKQDIKETKKGIKELELQIEKLALKIEISKNHTLLLLGSFGIFFLGVLAKGFHWI